MCSLLAFSVPMNFPRSLFILLCLGGAAFADAGPVATTYSVESLMGEILQQNPELSFYRAELEAAGAAQRAAATRDNPEVSLELGRKRVRDSAGILAGEGTAWSVSVTQTFEWPGRLALRKAIAGRDVALAELGVERFRAALAARARTLAFGLSAAHQRAAATAEVAARYRALRDVLLAREPGGVTPLLETRVLEAQELALQRRATEARLAVQAALFELNQLRGVPADTPVTVTAVEPNFAAVPELAAALAAARESNFEFRAAQLELEQQGLRVSLARHEAKPSFAVGPYFSEEKAGERERTVGIGLSIPIPVNGRAGANAATADARRRQAEVAVLVAQLAMEREVAAALQRLAGNLEQITQWAPDAAARFRDAAELADRHFRLGAVPLATYVELQTSYLEAIDALCETQREAIEAAGELQCLTGLETVTIKSRQN